MVNIQKYGTYNCVRTHRTLCVLSSPTAKSQAAISTFLLNYMKYFPLKYTTIYRFEKKIFTMIRNSIKLFICWYILSTWC